MAKRKSARWRAAKARRTQARRTPRSSPAHGNLLDDGTGRLAPDRPAQIELIDDGKRDEAPEIPPPRWMWFKRMDAPAGAKVHLLEVSPAQHPLPIGKGSLCGTIEGRELGYPWDERQAGDRYCIECVEALFRAERIDSHRTGMTAA